MYIELSKFKDRFYCLCAGSELEIPLIDYWLQSFTPMIIINVNTNKMIKIQCWWSPPRLQMPFVSVACGFSSKRSTTVQ